MAGIDPEAVQVAKIAANATVEAARIAADASRFGSVVTAVAAIVALVGAVISAIFAYRGSRRPIEHQEMLDQRDDEQLRARLQIHLTSALVEAEEAVADYEGSFSEPVHLRVLNLSRVGDKHFYSVLGSQVVDALARVDRAERNYRVAKDPFQRAFGSAERDAPPAVLRVRPEGFESVARTAKTYRTELRRLKNRLKESRSPLAALS